MKKIIFAVIIMVSFISPKALSQTQELRGAWIATVINLDWPSRGVATEKQQNELLFILDRLQISGINTIFFQIRCEADAFYQSDYEPWSY